MTDAPIFSWSLVSSVCLFCAHPSPAFCLVSFLQDLEVTHPEATATKLALTFTPLARSSLFVSVGSTFPCWFLDILRSRLAYTSVVCWFSSVFLTSLHLHSHPQWVRTSCGKDCSGLLPKNNIPSFPDSEKASCRLVAICPHIYLQLLISLEKHPRPFGSWIFRCPHWSPTPSPLFLGRTNLWGQISHVV